MQNELPAHYVPEARIASEQNWQIAFDELSKLVVQRFRPELEDFLPEGMRAGSKWRNHLRRLVKKSPEEFARDCLVQTALLAIKEVAKSHEVQLSILESVFQTFDRFFSVQRHVASARSFNSNPRLLQMRLII